MLTPPQNLAENSRKLRARIEAAARAAGRNVDSITLLAVSKGQPVSAIDTLARLGLEHFGENYLQEALPKIAALRGRELTWHFIGQLQSNKTRAVAENFAWVHTLDRLKLAERLSAQRPPFAAPLQVCLQLRLGSEPGKGGAPAGQLRELVAAVGILPRLRLRGLMCVPPAEPTPQAQRRWFAEARELRDALNRDGAALDTLSMGMSGDLEAAVAEGATLLRIGTALFGPRTSAVAGQ
jgi:pyridoxal phosphate enzyme (YggS family)